MAQIRFTKHVIEIDGPKCERDVLRYCLKIVNNHGDNFLMHLHKREDPMKLKLYELYIIYLQNWNDAFKAIVDYWKKEIDHLHTNDKLSLYYLQMVSDLLKERNQELYYLNVGTECANRMIARGECIGEPCFIFMSKMLKRNGGMLEINFNDKNGYPPIGFVRVRGKRKMVHQGNGVYCVQH